MAGKELSDDDLLGGSDAGWDEHGEDNTSNEFDIEREDPQDEVADGLDDDEPEEKEKEEQEEPEDSADEEEAGTEEESDDEDLAPYSQKIRKRIMRERKLKREAEERAEQEVDARQKIEERLYNSEQLAITLLSSQVERDIKDQTAALKKAKEEGETDAEIEAQGQLDELRAKKRQIDHAAESIKPPVKVEKPAVSPQTKRWMDRNKWFVTGEFAAEATYARAIDQELSKEGKFSVGTPEYFSELDRRIHGSIPTLRSKIKKTLGGGTQRPNVVGTGRAAPRPFQGGNVSKNKITLSRDEVEFARSLGLTSKDQLQEFARQKLSRMRDEQNSAKRR